MLLKDNDIFRGRQVQVGNRYQGRHCGPSYVSGSVTMMHRLVAVPARTSDSSSEVSVFSVSRLSTSFFEIFGSRCFCMAFSLRCVLPRAKTGPVVEESSS